MRMSKQARSLSGAVLLSLAGGVALGQQVPQGDEQIQSAVTAALSSDAQLHGQQVTATVKQGVVTLNGSVNDDSARLAAEQTAAQVAGVKSIDDNISVGAGQQAPAASAQAAPAASGQAPAPQQDESQLPPPPPDEAGPQQGQYPQQNQYPAQQGQYPQYPQQGSYQQPYGYQPTPAPAPLIAVSPQRQDASGPVTIPAGTLLTVRTNEPLNTAKLDAGTIFQVTATNDVYQNGVVAIPRGSTLTGVVVEAKKAGAFGGSPELELRLSTLTLDGQTYQVPSDVWSTKGPNKAGYTAGNTVGGAAVGAIIGAIAGGGVGAGIGAVAGGATGAAVSGVTPSPRVGLPPEALLQFHLTAPLEVQPVKYNEAVRLAASVPQQPVLQRRPVYVVAPRPYVYPYAYYPYAYYPRYYRPGYYY